MRGKLWQISIGELKIPIEAFDDDIDNVEACTRAIEYLHENKINYMIGPRILAECGDKAFLVKSDVILANAGKHAQCEKLRSIIDLHNSKNKKNNA